MSISEEELRAKLLTGQLLWVVLILFLPHSSECDSEVQAGFPQAGCQFRYHVAVLTNIRTE